MPRDRSEDGHGQLLLTLSSYASSGTQIDLGYPDDFEGAKVLEVMAAQRVLNGLNHAVPAPAIIAKIVWAESAGYDAVIQANHFDPGVEAGRLAARIPIVGLLRSALHVGSILADRIGLLVPLASHTSYVRRIARAYGMEHVVVDVRSIGIYGSDMAARKPEFMTVATAVVADMVRENGVEMLLPLGGAIVPQIISPVELEAAVGLPVLNAPAVGIRLAEMLVSLGMTHSPIAYPHAAVAYEDFLARSS